MKESSLNALADLAGVLIGVAIVLVLVLAGATPLTKAGQRVTSLLADESDYYVWISETTEDRASTLWIVCTRKMTRCLAASVVQTAEGEVWVVGAGVPRLFGAQTCFVVDQIAVEPEDYTSVALPLLGKLVCWVPLEDGRIRNNNGVVLRHTSREPYAAWLSLLSAIPRTEFPRT